MVGSGKLLAAGNVTCCCPAYKSGRQPVSTPLASKILDCKDLFKKKNRKIERCSVQNVLIRQKIHIYDRRAYSTLSRTTSTPNTRPKFVLRSCGIQQRCRIYDGRFAVRQTGVFDTVTYIWYAKYTTGDSSYDAKQNVASKTNAS